MYMYTCIIMYKKLPLRCLNGQNAVNKPVTSCSDKEAEQPSAGNTYKWAAKNFEEYSWLILTVRYSMLEFVTVSNAEIESRKILGITDELKIPLGRKLFHTLPSE